MLDNCAKLEIMVRNRRKAYINLTGEIYMRLSG
jgi:hypothetical protein